MAFNPQAAAATGWTSERIAAVLFGIYLAVSLPILISLGSRFWFMGDEWAFLVRGDLTNPAVLFEALHGHWSTFPILVYRTLYAVFGLHSYLPFQLCLILLHLTLCYLLRVIMRRAGVGPWMATIVAAVFVLFGPGATNILSAVQISQVGSIVFGLTQMILAEHKGKIDRRDWLGLLCGLLSVMSSGFGPPMVAIVGLAVICRRGWRPAMFHVLPLALIYVGWYAAYQTPQHYNETNLTLALIAQWMILAASGVFLALGGYTIVAAALAAILLPGLILAWTPLSLPALRRKATVPAAMLVGAFAMQLVLCLTRGFLGADGAQTDRYIAISAALTLPALAVAADALVRRWRWLMPVFCALILTAIAVNTTRFGVYLWSPPTFTSLRESLLAAAYSPLAEQAPADLVISPNVMTGSEADMGFLLAARDSGRLPPPPEMTEMLRSRTELRLSVRQLPGPIPEHQACELYDKQIEIKPKKYDLYGFTTPVLISLSKSGARLRYNASWPSFPVIRILRSDLRLYLAPKPPESTFGFCRLTDDASFPPEGAAAKL